MRKPQRHSWRLAGTTMASVVAVLVTVSTVDAWQDRGRPEKSPAGSRFQSPLLEGLRNTVEESQLIGKSGADLRLLDQLEQADQILADARAQNRYALRLIGRQARVGIAATSPNILLVTVDRLALGDPGCCGQKKILTPRIDEFASEGLRLTQFHSGGPESLPSRWSLLTGQMLHRLQRNVADRYRVRENQLTLAEGLWKAGYLTAFFGLWKNEDNPQGHGFENWSGFLKAGDALAEFPESIHVDGARVRIVENARGGRRVSGMKMLTSELQSWIRHQRTRRRQFFVHFAVSSFADLEAGSSTSPMTADEYRKRVERADRCVGQILDTLRETGLDRRTCVVLTAESGPHERCHAAVKELESLGETRTSPEGLRNGDLLVPCLVRWPEKIEAGSQSHRACAIWDLLPTFLSLAVARDRVVTDGDSLAPTLKGESQKIHQLMYWESGRGGKTHQTAWKNGWKAFKPGGTKQVQLYRMSDDPAERIDRADEFPDVLAGLIKR